MENKFTPGPWHQMVGGFKGNGTGIAIYATNENLETICVVDEDRVLVNRKQDHVANAKLIASAPDLLEAALLIQAEIDTEGLLTSSYEKLLAAIKKAT